MYDGRKLTENLAGVLAQAQHTAATLSVSSAVRIGWIK